MKYKYVVIVDGSGFEMEFEGFRGEHGFTTTRYVEAENITQAEAIAIESVAEELRSMLIPVDREKNPMRAILVEELDEDAELHDVAGFCWAPEGPDSLN